MSIKHLSDSEYDAFKTQGLAGLNDEAYDRLKLPADSGQVQTDADAEGQKAYFKQHQVEGAVNSVARPIKTALDSTLGEVSSLINKYDAPTLGVYESSPLDSLKTLGSGVSAAIENTSDWAQKKLVSGEMPNIANSVNRVADLASVLNPFPKDTGGIVVAHGVNAGLGILSEPFTSLKPEKVENTLRNNGMPGASRPFDRIEDIRAAKLAEVNKIVEREQTDLSQKEHFSSARKALKDVTGSEEVLPQADRQQSGINVQNSIDPRIIDDTGKPVLDENGNSKTDFNKEIGKDKLPLENNSQALREQLALQPNIRIPDVGDALGELRSELSGYLTRGQDVHAASILKPYLEFGKFHPDFLPGVDKPVSDYPVALPTKLYADVRGLRDIANSLTSEFQGSRGKTALLKAADIIENGLYDKIPEDLASKLEVNKKRWAEFYGKHYNPLINDIRGNITNPVKPSSVLDMVFDNEDTMDAVRKSVGEREWDRLRADRINRLVGSIIGDADPSKALDSIENNKPGYLAHFIKPEEMDNLRVFAGDMKQRNILAEDTNNLEMNQREARNNRTGDPKELAYLKRADDKLTFAKQSVIGTVGGVTGALAGFASHSWPVTFALTTMGGTIGVLPEVLSKLYLDNPSIRAGLVKLSESRSNLESIENTAKLVSTISQQKEEVRKLQDTKEGEKKKPIPPHLKPYVSTKKEEQIILPSDIKPYRPGAPTEEPLQGQDPLDAGETYQWPVSAH